MNYSKTKGFSLVILTIASMIVTTRQNYLLNIDFESPVVTPSYESIRCLTNGCIPNWSGEFDLAGPDIYQ